MIVIERKGKDVLILIGILGNNVTIIFGYNNIDKLATGIRDF